MNVCCLNCGQYFGEFDSRDNFCCDDCENKFIKDLEEEMQKDEISQSTGKCLNCGKPCNHSNNFCDEDCEAELIKYLEDEEALECYKKAIDIDPNDKDAWVNKGVTLNNLGRYEEAITALKKALRINPFPPGFFFFS